jgi:hypothetical protein
VGRGSIDVKGKWLIGGVRLKHVPPVVWGLYACVMANDVWFLTWRWDKPANNPGGPLASMGGWVMAWEVSTTTLPLVVSLIVLPLLIRCAKQK